MLFRSDGITYSSGNISADLKASGGLTMDAGQIKVDRTVVDTWYDANGAASGVQDNLDTHTNASSGVHGVTGSVVGTTDTQSLSNNSLLIFQSSSFFSLILAQQR